MNIFHPIFNNTVESQLCSVEMDSNEERHEPLLKGSFQDPIVLKTPPQLLFRFTEWIKKQKIVGNQDGKEYLSEIDQPIMERQ